MARSTRTPAGGVPSYRFMSSGSAGSPTGRIVVVHGFRLDARHAYRPGAGEVSKP